MSDLTFESHGSVVTLGANTPAGAAWVREHLPPDAMRWMGKVVIEPRYVEDIAVGATNDGLLVEGW